MLLRVVAQERHGGCNRAADVARLHQALGAHQLGDLGALLGGFHAEPCRLVRAIAADAERNGATILRGRVEGFQNNATRVTAVIVDGVARPVERIVLAAGADPNYVGRWGRSAFQQSVLRDNRMELVERLVAKGGRLAILGTGEAGLEQAARELAEKMPGQVAVRLEHHEELARRIFGGGGLDMGVPLVVQSIIMGREIPTLDSGKPRVRALL